MVETGESNGQKNIHARSIREYSTMPVFFPRSCSRIAKREEDESSEMKR